MNFEHSGRPGKSQVGQPLNQDGALRSGPTPDVRDLVGLLASSKKLAANRNNAKKSTGPRTARGKSHARWNALKHGAFATQRLIRGEDAKAYRRLSAQVFAEAAPKTAIACMLVDQILGDPWRLKRVEQAERAYFEEVRVAALARVLRTLSVPEIELVPGIVKAENTSIAEGPEARSCRVSNKLQAATNPDKLMLDGMVAADSVFPYSSLEQIRRSLIRDILRKEANLAELPGRGLAVEVRHRY
jgi:hypothetical protein